MVKLKRLKIIKYRNVRPGTELRFDDTRNLILGKNGSGKTTLLGLIAMASGWNFAELEEEAFSLEFEVHSNDHRVHFSFDNERSEEDPSLSYTFSLTIASYRFQGTASSLLLTSTEEPTLHLSSPPCSPFEHDFLHQLAHSIAHSTTVSQSLRKSPIDSLLSLRLDTASFRFDEALGTFYALTGQSAPPSRPAGPESLATSATVVVAPQLSVAINPRHTPYRFSARFLRELVANDQDISPSSALSSPGFSVLQDLATLLDCDKIELRPDISAISGTPRSRNITIQSVKFFFHGKGGHSISHDRLSYGQKRLVSFFFYLYFTSPGIVVADELVNGLHRSWIAASLDAIGDRQAFLTSQNPLLFDYIEFESVEQAQTRFITCRAELVDGSVQLVWTNMSEDDASAFFRGYEAEIEGVGDILINRGLW